MTSPGSPDRRPRIAVVFYSATGNVAALADALARGAEAAGAEVRLRRVVETAPAEAIDSNPRWRAHVDGTRVALASLEDLQWCDGVALGSPTRFGGPAAQLKAFLDTTGGLWYRGELDRLVGTAFTTASTLHGGLEATILAINTTFYHWGSVVVPLGYGPEHVRRVTGNPYGASFVSRSGASPDDDALEAARLQGARLATVTARVNGLEVPS